MIHPTAIISENCEVGDNVEIAPYVVIQGKVKIGHGTKIGAGATIGCKNGIVDIGENNDIGPHAYVGCPPQDISHKDQVTRLTIGNNNILREFITVSVGTNKQDGVTIIGNDCMLMCHVHVGHDCIIRDRVIIANTANIAGHVLIDDDVKIGGSCNFSQFIRLGKHAYIAGDATGNKDLLPFTLIQGKYAKSRATNKIGLERAGFTKTEIDNIHKAIRALIMGQRSLEQAIEKIKIDCEQDKNIKYLLDFVQSSEKGLAR